VGAKQPAPTPQLHTAFRDVQLLCHLLFSQEASFSQPFVAALEAVNFANVSHCVKIEELACS
jgi:hypothetical protein